MIPILFEYNATDFTTHGIGDLVDIIECKSTQNDEGEYELSFSYPVTGFLFGQLTIGRLVYAKSNPWHDEQLFRIYGYEKEIGGKVTINCQHISYDLANIPVKRFESAANATCNTVLANMKSNAVAITGLNISKFTFSSNVTGTAKTDDGKPFKVETPSSARAVLLDGDESIKGCFPGDLVFNNYTVKIVAPNSSDPDAGRSDRDGGAVIEYGIDLMDMNQEENISEMVTGVYPFYTYTQDNEDNTPLITYGSVQYASGTFLTHRVAPLDLTSYFPNQAEHTSPTAAQLNTKAQQWMAAEDGFGRPEVNLTVSYASLGKDVRLHDEVTVRFVKMGIDTSAKVTSYVYDVLAERITEIGVGKARKSVLFSLEDASRLRKGLIPPERIQNKSITAEKYAESSVGSSALGTGSVGSSKIGDGAVTEHKIDDYAVVEMKVGQSAITSQKIKDGAVQYGKIGDSQVDTLKLNDFSITSTKLDGSNTITRRKRPDGTWQTVGPSVITMKVGNKEIAEVKMEQDAQNAIATVWYIDSIKAQWITADQVTAELADVDYIAVRHLDVWETFNIQGVVNGCPYN